MRLADQRAADAGAMEGRLDRQRRQRHGRKFLAAVLHVKPRKQDMADHLAVFLGHQFDAPHRRLSTSASTSPASACWPNACSSTRRIASRSLGVAALIDIMLMTSFIPFSILAPRRNSSARDGPAARPLHFDQPDRAVSAGDRQADRRESRPGSPAPSPGVERSSFSRSGLAADLDLAPRAGKGRQAADVVVDIAGRPRPVDARLRLVDLLGIGDALRRLRRQSQAAALQLPPAPRPSVGAPICISRSCSSPAVMSGAIATRSAMATGPVSRPSSIFMTIMPVSWSPAMIARWIGAAPRQRGSSEAWPL